MIDPTGCGPVSPGVGVVPDPEALLTPEELARFIPSNRSPSGHVHPATVRKWISDGYRGVKLPALRTPGGAKTRMRWFEEWAEALDDAATGAPSAGPAGKPGPRSINTPPAPSALAPRSPRPGSNGTLERLRRLGVVPA